MEIEKFTISILQWEQQLTTFSQLLNFDNVSNIAPLNKVELNYYT